MKVGVLEAKNRFSELLDRAARGEEVVVTKHGRAFVRLSPARPHQQTEDIEALIERVKQRRGEGLGRTWRELKQDIEQGRT